MADDELRLPGQALLEAIDALPAPDEDEIATVGHDASVSSLQSPVSSLQVFGLRLHFNELTRHAQVLQAEEEYQHMLTTKAFAPNSPNDTSVLVQQSTV